MTPECPRCGDSEPHSLDADFQHFLSYTCTENDQEKRLLVAYTHSNDRGIMLQSKKTAEVQRSFDRLFDESELLRKQLAEQAARVEFSRMRIQEIIQVRAGLTGVASADDRMKRMAEIAEEILIYSGEK